MKLFFVFKCLNKTRDTLNLIYMVILCTAKRERKKRMKGGGNEGRKERQREERKRKETEREREREKTQYKYVSMQSRARCFFVTSQVYFIPIGKAGLDLSRYKFLSCMIILLLHIL